MAVVAENDCGFTVKTAIGTHTIQDFGQDRIMITNTQSPVSIKAAIRNAWIVKTSQWVYRFPGCTEIVML